MARLGDRDWAALREEFGRSERRALGGARRRARRAADATADAWYRAGDNLSEKAIAALAAGDDDEALRQVRRLVALPAVDGEGVGPVAAALLLLEALADRSAAGAGDDERVDPERVDRLIALLPDLEPAVAVEAVRTLDAALDLEPADAVRRRIRAVVPAERSYAPPFSGIPEAGLPDAVLGVLRVVLAVREA